MYQIKKTLGKTSSFKNSIRNKNPSLKKSLTKQAKRKKSFINIS